MAAAMVRSKPTPKNEKQTAHNRAVKREMGRDKASPSDLKPVIDQDGFVFGDMGLDLLPPLPFPPLDLLDGLDFI